MSEQIAASPMPKFRSPPDPLVSTRRLNRRQVMAVVRLRIEIGSGNDAAVAAAQTAVGPLWPALQSLAEFQREDVVRRRQSPGAWARIVVAIDLLVEYLRRDRCRCPPVQAGTREASPCSGSASTRTTDARRSDSGNQPECDRVTLKGRCANLPHIPLL